MEHQTPQLTPSRSLLPLVIGHQVGSCFNSELGSRKLNYSSSKGRSVPDLCPFPFPVWRSSEPSPSTWQNGFPCLTRGAILRSPNCESASIHWLPHPILPHRRDDRSCNLGWEIVTALWVLDTLDSVGKVATRREKQGLGFAAPGVFPSSCKVQKHDQRCVLPHILDMAVVFET